jgi:hypothetical protein
MPIEQRSKLLLVINMKTAKALGLTVPQSLLLRVVHPRGRSVHVPRDPADRGAHVIAGRPSHRIGRCGRSCIQCRHLGGVCARVPTPRIRTHAIEGASAPTCTWVLTYQRRARRWDGSAIGPQAVSRVARRTSPQTVVQEDMRYAQGESLIRLARVQPAIGPFTFLGVDTIPTRAFPPRPSPDLVAKRGSADWNMTPRNHRIQYDLISAYADLNNDPAAARINLDSQLFVAGILREFLFRSRAIQIKSTIF